MQPLYILELIITLLTGFHPKTLCTSRAKKKKIQASYQLQEILPANLFITVSLFCVCYIINSHCCQFKLMFVLPTLLPVQNTDQYNPVKTEKKKRNKLSHPMNWTGTVFCKNKNSRMLQLPCKWLSKVYTHEPLVSSFTVIYLRAGTWACRGAGGCVATDVTIRDMIRLDLEITQLKKIGSIKIILG